MPIKWRVAAESLFFCLRLLDKLQIGILMPLSIFRKCRGDEQLLINRMASVLGWMGQQASCIYLVLRWKADYTAEGKWGGNFLELCSECPTFQSDVIIGFMFNVSYSSLPLLIDYLSWGWNKSNNIYPAECSMHQFTPVRITSIHTRGPVGHPPPDVDEDPEVDWLRWFGPHN